MLLRQVFDGRQNGEVTVHFSEASKGVHTLRCGLDIVCNPDVVDVIALLASLSFPRMLPSDDREKGSRGHE